MMPVNNADQVRDGRQRTSARLRSIRRKPIAPTQKIDAAVIADHVSTLVRDRTQSKPLSCVMAKQRAICRAAETDLGLGHRGRQTRGTAWTLRGSEAHLRGAKADDGLPMTH